MNMTPLFSRTGRPFALSSFHAVGALLALAAATGANGAHAAGAGSAPLGLAPQAALIVAARASAATPPTAAEPARSAATTAPCAHCRKPTAGRDLLLLWLMAGAASKSGPASFELDAAALEDALLAAD